MKRLILALILIAAPAFGATPTDTTVAVYHGAPDRAGNYIVPGLDWQSTGSVHRIQEFDGTIEGHSYAQPLYWRPAGAGHDLIIAATESDVVYALDAATGHVVWRANLGRPVSRAALPCGNIDPLGITGTPVIDTARGTVYLDAMLDVQGAPRHLVYGLRLADGSVLPGFPIDVAAGLAARGSVSIRSFKISVAPWRYTMAESSCRSAVTTAIAATIMVWSWPWTSIRRGSRVLGQLSSEGRNLGLLLG